MKTLIVYTSQTGFTKKYAGWIAERTNADLLDLKDAQKKGDTFFEKYDAIVYGGWAMAEKLVKVKWFLDKAPRWKKKRLAVFCVGGSTNDNPQAEKMLQNMLTDEQRKYIKAFYCQGGYNYEKMSVPCRMAMKMFVSALKKKKDASDKDRELAEMISSSCDFSDIKYTDPIVDYLKDSVSLSA